MAKPYFTRRRRISLKKAHIVLVDKCVLFSGGRWWIHDHNFESASPPLVWRIAGNVCNSIGKNVRAILGPFLATPSPTNKKTRHDVSGLFVGGRWWIRTTEAKTQQIYSLPPLATREISHIKVHLFVWTWLELVNGVEPSTC